MMKTPSDDTTLPPERPPLFTLFTPMDWYMEAFARASRHVGTQEGAIALAEAKRYKAFAEILDYLQLLENECRKTREELRQLKEQRNE
jgi:hypothetical protein